ncbi:MAG: argininosuccinate lyase [bacterium]
MTERFHAPVWDRGEPIDSDVLAFTIGDDPVQDRRLVEPEIEASLAHAEGLHRVGLLTDADADAIARGLEALRESFRRDEWTVETADEDVHSAVERRLIALVGEAGKRLHTGRSRNEQVAVDVRLWLREAVEETETRIEEAAAACRELAARHGDTPIPGYTHLRRAMPSTLRDWAEAHARAFEADAEELDGPRRRIRECPLGSGAGYGVPLPLDRAFVAERLGFDRPESPPTLVQHARARAELAYVTALEAVALDVGKLAFDLWLFSTREFGFFRLPIALTTGSSLMPHKRNPDVVELLRAHARATMADRTALLDVVRDLPSGYHRDFQLVKPPLFRAHDRMQAMLGVLTRLVSALEIDRDAMEQACADPALEATERVLERAKAGVPFRDAYRAEAERPDR